MRKSILRTGLAVILILALLLGGLWYGYTHRPVPGNLRTVLFEGVTYYRDVRSEPRPLVIHVVIIDLAAPGIGFLVTPGDPTLELPLSARKTSQFLAEFGLQIAVNGDFFSPWYSNLPWDYYPRAGDPVQVRGLASSQGTVYSPGQYGRRDARATLYLSPDNRASIDSRPREVYNAISGRPKLIANGEILVRSDTDVYAPTLNPRTALALDEGGQHLIIIMVDGRQPNYSEGVTLFELATIVLEYGGNAALNLDGGGSTTLVMQGASGQPEILNSPIDNRIPGRERPVANHLGIFAREREGGPEGPN